MDSDPHSADTNEGSGSLTVGNVEGGIHGSILAGRDVIQKITHVFSGGPGEVRDRRNQLILLKKVQGFWVEGVLEDSVHRAARIELGKEEQADAVERPWEMVLEAPGAPDRRLPAGKRILDVFDEMGRTLLILGEPGSGKTNTLLELAREAIARAERDATQPIPVVFVLSSWAEKRLDFVKWLIEELNAKYEIPKKVGRAWVENNNLLLLLDGLDEVEPGQRAACVEAINTFRQEYGLTALAICSRVREYQALEARLKLQGAICLQPLAAPQIQDYLASAGGSLTILRTVMQHDAALQELAQSPLMLSVMSLAYQDLPGEAVQNGELLSLESRRNQLFATYVDRMFKRRRTGQRYTFEQSMSWLTWLAQRMFRHNQTVFLMEELQPSWLATRAQRWFYVLSSRLLGAGIMAFAALFLLLGVGLKGSKSADPTAVFILWLPLLIGCVGAGLTIGLLDGWRLTRYGQETAADGARKPRFRQSALKVLSTSLISALGFGLAIGGVGLIPGLDALYAVAFFDLAMVGCGWGAASGAMVFFGFGLIFGLRRGWSSARRDIQTVESLAWSWRRFLMVVLASMVISGMTLIVTSLTREPGAKLWDFQGNLTARLDRHTAQVVWAGFNRDGTRLVTVSGDDTAWLWDGRDGTLIAPISKGNWYAPSITFSPDGTRILTGGPVQDAVWLWVAGNGTLISNKEIASGVIEHGPDFSPDGARIAATVDGTARLWDARDGQIIPISPLPRESFGGFVQGGKRFVTHQDNTTVLRNAEDGKLIATLQGTTRMLRPNGRRIVTGSNDGTVQLWDPTDGKLVADLGHHQKLLVGPEGTRIVTINQDRTARLWNAENGKFMALIEGPVESDDSLSFNVNGTRLLALTEGAKVRLWDGEDGRLVAILEDSPVLLLRFSPDGKRIATVSRKGTTRLWNVGDGRRIAELDIEGVPAGLLQLNAKMVESYPLFDPEGARLATASQDGAAQLWDGKNGRFIRTLENHLDTGHANFLNAFDAFFSPDGTRLATISRDDIVRLWDGKDGTLVAVIKGVGKPRDTNPLAFSTDGRMVTISAGEPVDRRPQSALWLIPGLLIGLFAGLRYDFQEVKTFPNQGVWLSLRNATIAGLIGGLILALISAFILVLFKQPLVPSFSVLAGLFASFGVLAALWYGGLDVLQHFTLRLILSVKKQIAWNYTRFLDHTAERILLRKVGGGYIFTHRLLLEYLATRAGVGDERLG
jgi:WD40 repeat protein